MLVFDLAWFLKSIPLCPLCPCGEAFVFLRGLRVLGGEAFVPPSVVTLLADKRPQDVALREYPLVGAAGVIGGRVVVAPDLPLRIAQHLAAVVTGLDRAQHGAFCVLYGIRFHF